MRTGLTTGISSGVRQGLSPGEVGLAYPTNSVQLTAALGDSLTGAHMWRVKGGGSASDLIGSIDLSQTGGSQVTDDDLGQCFRAEDNGGDYLQTGTNSADHEVTNLVDRVMIAVVKIHSTPTDNVVPFCMGSAAGSYAGFRLKSNEDTVQVIVDDGDTVNVQGDIGWSAIYGGAVAVLAWVWDGSAYTGQILGRTASGLLTGTTVDCTTGWDDITPGKVALGARINGGLGAPILVSWGCTLVGTSATNFTGSNLTNLYNYLTA